MSEKVPFIIYEGTYFLRKTMFGRYQALPTYDGTVRSLPDAQIIRRALKHVGRGFDARSRFCLVTFDAGANYEALPGWGIVAGNMYQRDLSDLPMVLYIDGVEAIALVDNKGDVEYVTRQDISND